jgi:hypothetical protein
MEDRLMIPANSVRLSLLPKINYEFHKFPAKILDYLILTISSRSYPHCEYRLRALQSKIDVNLFSNRSGQTSIINARNMGPGESFIKC